MQCSLQCECVCGIFFYSLNEVHLSCMSYTILGCWFALLWMDTSLSTVILILLIFSMMIVNIFFRHRRRRCRCCFVIASFYIDSLDVTMCVQAAHLHWYSSSFMVQIEFNTLESPLKWSFKRKTEGARERERERQWKHLLMCVRSCMEKRQMCSMYMAWHGKAKMRLVWASSTSKLHLNRIRTFACIRVFRLISQRSAIQKVLRYRGKCCRRCWWCALCSLGSFSSLSCSFLFVSCS